MTDSATTQKTAKLNFDGKTYELESLSKETKDLVRGMQVADTQLRMHEDTIKLISIGKAKMIEDLKKILEHIKPIEDN